MVNIIDVVSKGSQDGQYQQTKNQKRDEHGAVHQEFIEEVAKNELTKQPDKEEYQWPGSDPGQ